MAREVGIAATSIYLHFADIDALKAALVIEGFTGLQRARGKAAEGTADPALALRARWGACVHFALENPGYYRLMFGPELPTTLAFDAPD